MGHDIPEGDKDSESVAQIATVFARQALTWENDRGRPWKSIDSSMKDESCGKLLQILERTNNRTCRMGASHCVVEAAKWKDD